MEAQPCQCEQGVCRTIHTKALLQGPNEKNYHTSTTDGEGGKLWSINLYVEMIFGFSALLLCRYYDTRKAGILGPHPSSQASDLERDRGITRISFMGCDLCLCHSYSCRCPIICFLQWCYTGMFLCPRRNRLILQSFPLHPERSWLRHRESRTAT